MYCLMILAVLGLMALADRTTGWANRGPANGRPSVATVPARTVQQLSAGIICALALFATMGASWSVNRYMPEDPANNTMGLDAWRAHTIKKADGHCPKYAPVPKCADPITKNYKPNKDDGILWCAGIAAENWPAVCGRPAPWLKQ